ncbi:MAG: PspC domain-containing protein [Bacteroidales bacterium]|nr:PspC domain-containing protein [Bacteroidales bacterium]
MSNNKRLERDLGNKVLGGVCSGLGNYFDIDPTFWRVLFFFLFFMGCSGLLIYIILWIVMPSAVVQPGSSVVQDAEVVGEAVEPKKSNGSMTAGLILIGIGAISLLARYIPQISWHTAWPILLIIIGIIIIIPKNKKS